MALPSPLPDDPRKWEGWSKYNSPNLYERLGLHISENPSHPIIEDHCRQLLIWWQKKLPLKNQPSNPLAQLLRNGLDEAPHLLSEARTLLLDPKTREEHDQVLRASQKEISLVEIGKYLDFTLAGGYLTAEAEKNLVQIGREHGISIQELKDLIDRRMTETGATRIAAVETRTIPFQTTAPEVEAEQADESEAQEVQTPPARRTVVAPPPSTAEPADRHSEFMRMLQLSGLEEEDFNQDRRETFIAMGRGLGIDEMEADEMIDEFLESLESTPHTPPPPVGTRRVTSVPPVTTNRIPQSTTPKANQTPPSANSAPQKVAAPVLTTAEERAQFLNFRNSLDAEMLFIPSATFSMGSTSANASPNESPVTQVQLSRYYIARHLVTNAQYEKFDPSHKAKRAPGADDSHPVVYVTHREASQFCQWLSGKDKKRFRLPTEAEWEYAAKGSDNREFPWGNDLMEGKFCNFADVNTQFPWSDHDMDCGFKQTSPVGSFPRGASPFGAEDMAGNVWEWCADFFDNYRGGEVKDPKGPLNGVKRVYRGGSWRSRLITCRTTSRGFNTLEYSFSDVGFRVAADA